MTLTKKRIEILVPYPKGLGPSQRFRIEIYLGDISENDAEIGYHPFLTESGYSCLYSNSGVHHKVWAISKGFLKRIILLPRLLRSDAVLVQREASPLGPPVFEWIIKKVFRKKLIYDLDDAIWLPNFAEVNAKWQRLKFYRKVDYIMGWSDMVIAGNDFISARARLFNDKVCVIPTVVDTERVHFPRSTYQPSYPITIGWTGTHSTNRHIEYLKPVFEELAKKYDFRLLLVSNQRPDINLDSVEYVEWSKETEMQVLKSMDIGLMPLLPDFKFAQGKCGFKAIQYMALGIPTLASPLGVNAQIIQHKENGLLCSSHKEWTHSLTEVLDDYSQVAQMADKGRSTIVGRYSKKANLRTFKKALLD